MVNRSAACAATVAAVAALTLGLAAPASAVVRYYSQDVKGNALAKEKLEQGFVVTWLGCHGRKGTVYWADGY